MQAVTGLHRKSVLRLTHGELARKPRRKQRRKTYGGEVERAIRKNHILIDRLRALPALKAGVTEDVRLTLLDNQAVMAV